MKYILCAASLAFALALPGVSPAAIIINEVLYDDVSTDDREFVEIYNNGAAAVDISGWILIGRDVTTVNPTTTVPAATMLGPGGYYVFGNAGTLNANQTLAVNFLENDIESVELRDAGSVLQDAVMYETNKGIAGNLTGSGLPAEVGPGIFGNHQAGVDLAGTPLNGNVSHGRFVDGRDTNNNGRDFGLRPSTPGTTNAPGGNMSAYIVPNPDSLALGTSLPGAVGTFVNPKVIDPTVVDGSNPNAIAAPGGGFTKAYVGWDPTGGGNGATTNAVFDTTASQFGIKAYLATDDLPVQSNAAGVMFRGSEITLYGIGSGDVFTNLTDLTGDIGLGPATLPAAETANGFTGVAWIYERVGAATTGGPISEKLHLVDANDGGDSDLGGNTPLDWLILASFDLSSTASAWHNLGIKIDAAGNGVAHYDTNIVNFVTSTALNGAAFNVGYRENLQVGADGTPDALLRPATWTVPEPASLTLLMLGLAAIATRRRK